MSAASVSASCSIMSCCLSHTGLFLGSWLPPRKLQVATLTGTLNISFLVPEEQLDRSLSYRAPWRRPLEIMCRGRGRRGQQSSGRATERHSLDKRTQRPADTARGGAAGSSRGVRQADQGLPGQASRRMAQADCCQQTVAAPL